MPDLEKLKIGRFEIVRICDGRFLVAGGAMFKGVPREVWSPRAEPDASGRVAISLNCFLVSGPGPRILVDTGVGPDPDPRYARSYELQRESGIFDGLRALGLSPEDIDIIFHTHLHFDHCGADTRPGEDGGEGRWVPAFPNARCIVRKGEWEKALDPHGPDRTSYLPGRLRGLEGTGALDLIEGDAEIAAGIETVFLPGHTADHQGLKIVSEGETLVMCGDTISSAAHVEIQAEMSFDLYPAKNRETGAWLREEAVKGKWFLAFGHDPRRPWGKIGKDPGGFRFLPV